MNLNIQDLLAIWGPGLMLTGFMWRHFNNRINELKTDIKSDIKNVEEKLGADIKDVKVDIKRVEEKLGADIKDVKVDIKRVEEKLGADIKRVEEKLGADIKWVEEKLGADIKRVEEKVDAVRDRVSRIEGQLVPAQVISFEEKIPKPAARLTQSKLAQVH